MEEIEANATLLLNMVNNILTISKAEAHKNELVVEPVDFVDLLGFIRKSLEPVAKNKGIALTAKTDADVPVSMADWEKLRRIVENLVDNAIKYTHVGGRVDVRATFNGACIVVSVADDGMGIDEADQEGIFERYRQAAPVAQPPLPRHGPRPGRGEGADRAARGQRVGGVGPQARQHVHRAHPLRCRGNGGIR